MSKFKLLRKITTTVLFCLLLINVSGQSQLTVIQDKINELQRSTGFANAGIGVCISDIKTGEVLFKSEPQLSLVPASIMKVITTATALEIFGPDFRFVTTFSGYGTVKNDTLFGDLRIVGGGDPTLGSSYFPENNQFMEKWIQTIQKSNVKVIAGNLIVDASIYEPQSIPDTWTWEDIGNYYGAGASGITVYDNLYEIHLNSGKEKGLLTKVERINPEIPGLDLENEVVSSEINSDQAYVFGSPMENRRIIRGTIPMNKSGFVVKASVPDPAVLLTNEFRKKLASNGISIAGKSLFEKVKNNQLSPAFLTVHESPPLREIIKVINYESVNLFAEHLLKHLAFQKFGMGTTKEGCKFVVQFWKDKGLDMTGFFMNDGSGLSRFNAFTPYQMVNILKFMKTKSDYFSDFHQSLPSAGNGTLTVFSKENFPDDCLRAKSGSMTRVRCYAGYLTTRSGRELSFSIMLNNFSCSQKEATRKIEEVLAGLRKE